MKNFTSFIREKKIYCGNDYLEVDIYPYTDSQKRGVKGKRAKRQKISPPKIKNFNEKMARRYFTQLINANFLTGGYHITLTYDNKHLPKTLEDAEHQAKNYLRRLSYLKKKKGLSPLRYIIVHEYHPRRVHHHIIIDSDLDRDTVENLWCKNKQPIGYVNADRLQPDIGGLGALTNYLLKDPKGKKRWSCSQNLKKPMQRTNDHKYSRRQIDKIAKTQPDAEFWEKKYPGHKLIQDYGYIAEYHEETGWHIYLKFIKKE
ncbi:MAG: hypothetical protein RSH79_04880 [Clostridiales bacterium]